MIRSRTNFKSRHQLASRAAYSQTAERAAADIEGHSAAAELGQQGRLKIGTFRLLRSAPPQLRLERRAPKTADSAI
jgi:hypothetical protein